MKLDLEKTFKYVFEDPQWKKKVLIGSIFSIFAVILQILNFVSSFISEKTIETYIETLTMTQILKYSGILGIVLLVILIISSILCGYYLKNTNLRILKPNSCLYEWKGFCDLFVVGLKNTFGTLVYIVLFTPVIVFFCVLMVSVSIFLVSNVQLCVVVLIIFIIMVLVLYILMICWLAASTLAFMTNLKFTSYFNFSLIWKFITKKFGDYIIYLLLLLAINTLFGVVSIILTITIVGIVLLPVVTFYSGLVLNELNAQFIRATLELDEK